MGYLDKSNGNQDDHNTGNIVHEVVTGGGQAAMWVDLHRGLGNMRGCTKGGQTKTNKTELSSNQENQQTDGVWGSFVNIEA